MPMASWIFTLFFCVASLQATAFAHEGEDHDHAGADLGATQDVSVREEAVEKAKEELLLAIADQKQKEKEGASEKEKKEAEERVEAAFARWTSAQAGLGQAQGRANQVNSGDESGSSGGSGASDAAKNAQRAALAQAAQSAASSGQKQDSSEKKNDKDSESANKEAENNSDNDSKKEAAANASAPQEEVAVISPEIAAAFKKANDTLKGDVPSESGAASEISDSLSKEVDALIADTNKFAAERATETQKIYDSMNASKAAEASQSNESENKAETVNDYINDYAGTKKAIEPRATTAASRRPTRGLAADKGDVGARLLNAIK